MDALQRRSAVRLSFAMLSVLSLATLTRAQLPSSSDDLQSLLTRMEHNIRENNRLNEQYVSDFERCFEMVDKKGGGYSQETQKFESVFSNGLWYRREVERNGKPLTEKQQEASQRRLDVVSNLEKDHDYIIEAMHGNPSNSFRTKLPYSYLATLFNNRLLRHDSIQGREVLVIESQPRADAHPTSDLEQSALDWKETTWVDAEDAMPVRYKVELLVDKGASLRKGSTSQVEFTRLQDLPSAPDSAPRYVWLEQHSESTFIERLLGMQFMERNDITSSNFRKFHSDSHLVEGAVQEIPKTTETKQR
jgi:hypothetical protein